MAISTSLSSFLNDSSSGHQGRDHTEIFVSSQDLVPVTYVSRHRSHSMLFYILLLLQLYECDSRQSSNSYITSTSPQALITWLAF